jgi:hypothetical protein
MTQPAIARQINAGPISQALALLPQQMDSAAARVMLVAIGLQESRLTARRQLVGNPPKPVGPAAGLWQFERGGGCAGVLTHQASRYWQHHVCANRGVPATTHALWSALQHDDVLAAATARLLLFTDPKLLPELDDEMGAWRLYLRTWRPGKPHLHTWAEFHRLARAVVAGK